MPGSEEGQAVAGHASPEQRLAVDRPLPAIRTLTAAVLRELEKFWRALWDPVLHTVRSERPLVEQLAYTLLLPWFVGLDRDDPAQPAATAEASPVIAAGRAGTWSFLRGLLEATYRLRLLPSLAALFRPGPPPK